LRETQSFIRETVKKRSKARKKIVEGMPDTGIKEG